MANNAKLFTLELLLVLAMGCAPAVVLENPSEWPAAWSARQLYNTPNAYIYASSPEAAGEADRLTISVIKELESQADGKGIKGLLVVTDTNDKPPISDLKQVFELMKLSVKTQRDGQTQPDIKKYEAQWQKAEKEAAKVGMDMSVLLVMFPIPIHSAPIVELLGLPDKVENDVDWAALVPTRAVIQRAVKKMIRAALKQNELGVVAQILAAPLLVIVESRMVNTIAVSRDVTIFGQLVNAQPGWSAEEKQRKINAYNQRKTKGGSVSLVNGLPAADPDAKAE